MAFFKENPAFSKKSGNLLSENAVFGKEPCMYHKRGRKDYLSVVSDCPWMAPSLAVEKQKQIAAAQQGLGLAVKMIQGVAL